MLYRYPVNAYANQADDEASIVKLFAKSPLKDMHSKPAEAREVDTWCGLDCSGCRQGIFSCFGKGKKESDVRVRVRADSIKKMVKDSSVETDIAPNESGKQAVRDPERCLHVTSYSCLCSSKNTAMQLIWSSVL